MTKQSNNNPLATIKDITDKIGTDLPSLVKDNKGAAIGAVIGYLFSDNAKAQSAILGAIAGALLVDKKDKKEF